MNTKSRSQLKEPLVGSDYQSNAVTQSHIFKIQAHALNQLFAKGQSLEKSNKILNDMKGVQAIIKKLSSDQSNGIIGDDRDLLRRRNYFGANKKPLRKPASLWSSVKQEATNIMYVGIIASAIIAAICGLFTPDRWKRIIEGIMIAAVTLVIIIISSATDLLKDQRFIELNSLVKDEDVTVVRGKANSKLKVSAWDVVVGDILLVETGMRMPADCVIIESSDLRAEESPEDDRIETKSKSAFLKRGDDPFLYADSLIMKGSATVLVCSVGELSSRGKYAASANDQVNVDTPLQLKMERLSKQFTLGALASGVIILIILICMTLFEASYGDTEYNTDENGGKVKNPNYKSSWAILISKLPLHVNLVVVLIVVSIPEGLPLTVGISLAFSVMTMFKSDRILIRKLEAPEKMAGCEELLVGKTATLTQNKMKVHTFYLEGNVIKNSRKDTFLHCELNNETIELVKDSILYNCSAMVEMSDRLFVPTGNGTECGLLNFLQEADIPINYLIQRKVGRIRAVLPFSSDLKLSAVAIEHPDRPNQIAIYIKGAPEVIMQLCPQALGEEGIIPINQPIHQDQYGNEVSYGDDFMEKVSVLAGQPLRVIGCAYTELHEQDWKGQESQFPTPSHCLTELVQTGALKFIMIGAFGLEDKLRTNVKSCVRYAQDQGQLNVRLVSGDHQATAIKVAQKTSILRNDQGGQNNLSVLSGDQFEELVGGISPDNEAELVDQERFQEIEQELRVIYRAKPRHKMMLTLGLKNMQKNVVVTGDGINDVTALVTATVGLAMGSGCSAAKEVSDIILTNDDFEATLKAVMWGRNIYQNIGRFLQFQVTVNISALLTIAIGSIKLMESPLSAVQLLWINLIMDTFAAFALSTEPPLPSVIQGPPLNERAQLLTPVIWRQVVGVSIWNAVVMTLMIFFGPMASGLKYKVTDTANDNDDKLKHLTMIFNTFVMLQLFNEVNCRKVGRRDFNVFESITHNIYFILVVAGTFAIQVVLVQMFPIFIRATSLTNSEWGVCIALGASPLLVSILLKLTPESWLSKVKLDKIVDENRDMSDNAILKKYDQGSKMKVDAVDNLVKKASGQAKPDVDDNFAAV